MLSNRKQISYVLTSENMTYNMPRYMYGTDNIKTYTDHTFTLYTIEGDSHQADSIYR